MLSISEQYNQIYVKAIIDEDTPITMISEVMSLITQKFSNADTEIKQAITFNSGHKEIILLAF